MATFPFVRKEIELKNNLVGEGFLKTPAREERRERVNIIGEIDSAKGFDYPSLYVFSQVLLSKDWGFEDEVEYTLSDPSAIEQTQINRRRSSTHIARSTAVLNKATGEYVYQSNFCFPFDYQLLTPQENKPAPNETPVSLSTRWPSLLMQVNSVDTWGRHRIEGYGYITFPSEAGYYEQTISTWRPKGTLYSKIHSYFLGGAVRIIELENLLQSSRLDELGHKDIVNRFGLETETAGEIKIHFNVTRQSFDLRQKSRQELEQKLTKEGLELKKYMNEEQLTKMKERMKEIPVIETNDFGPVIRLTKQ